MKIYNILKELNPTKENPFEGDLMSRQQPAEVLKTIIESFTEKSVIALNGKWGTGKTTFIKMWEKYMECEGYKVLHFNAWEDDYAEDPFIPLLASFQNIVGKEKSDICIKGQQVLLNAGGALISGFLKSKLGVDWKFIGEAIEKATDGLSEIASDFIKDYNKKKNAFTEFKKGLEEYANEISNDKPILFIVDELDRCNPHYAIKCLERIKHLFSVKNIVFILAIDRKQMCNSIKGAYGNNDFDANDYLQRFINYTYNLPYSNVADLIHNALTRFGFNLGQYDNSTMEKLFPLLCEGKELSIRNIERMILNIRLVIKHNQHIDLSVIILLIYFKMFEPEFYGTYSSGNMSTEEFVNKIESIFGERFYKKTDLAVSGYFYPGIVDLLILNAGIDRWKEVLISKEGKIQFVTRRMHEEILEECFKRKRNESLRFDLPSIVKTIEMAYSVDI